MARQKRSNFLQKMFDVHVTVAQLLPSLSFSELYESFYVASGH